MSQLTLYPYEDFDLGALLDEPLAVPCLGMIGIPKLPSHPNNGVRLSFDAISNIVRSSIRTLYTHCLKVA